MLKKKMSRVLSSLEHEVWGLCACFFLGENMWVSTQYISYICLTHWSLVSPYHREITRTGLSGPRFHAPLHNFTSSPDPAGGSVVHQWPRLQQVRSLAAFDITLLILVLEIPFNFQFDMQCAGNANFNVSFQVNASFEQILFPWHTWVRSKGLRTIGSWWPDKRTGLQCGQGWGKNFSRGQPSQDNSVGSGVVWVTGLFSLCGIIALCQHWFR